MTRLMLRLPGAPRAVVALFWVLALMLVSFCAHALVGFGGHVGDDVFRKWDNDAIALICAALCAARAISDRRERWAWAMLSIGSAGWALGNVYWTAFLIDQNPVPIPSVADGLWLSLYPFACVGLALLMRSRLRQVRPSACLDGVIAGSAAAALSAAIVVEAVLRTSGHGTAAEVTTSLAYPIGDVIVLGIVVGAVALGSWRLDRTWASLACGVVAFTITDGIFLYQTAAGTYRVGTIVDAGWLVATVLIAHAAWQPVEPPRDASGDGHWQVRVPATCALISLGILVYDHYHRTNVLAICLCAATIIALVLRMALGIRENAGMLQLSRAEATTDALTGLGNRRRLLGDLDDAFERTDGAAFRLYLLDLNGFKAYNDAHGHHAGDALLAHLAAQLRRTVGSAGQAYRLGGDEFCVLTEDAMSSYSDADISGALSIRGDGFAISAARGRIQIPSEASDVSAALGLVDARMYVDKNASRRPAGDQASRVLVQLQRESDRHLGEHVASVVSLAISLGEALGCTSAELDQIRLAAELHDVGKFALPDSILRKSGPLTVEEWALVRQHPNVAERILSEAPALAETAILVRSSHEHFDGDGYPDGLAGGEIPLGSRIIAVAEAYDAMTRGRRYREAIPPHAALAELRRCAGTQFDPTVIDALGGLPTSAPREGRRRHTVT